MRVDSRSLYAYLRENAARTVTIEELISRFRITQNDGGATPRARVQAHMSNMVRKYPEIVRVEMGVWQYRENGEWVPEDATARNNTNLVSGSGSGLLVARRRPYEQDYRQVGEARNGDTIVEDTDGVFYRLVRISAEDNEDD